MEKHKKNYSQSSININMQPKMFNLLYRFYILELWETVKIVENANKAIRKSGKFGIYQSCTNSPFIVNTINNLK